MALGLLVVSFVMPRKLGHQRLPRNSSSDGFTLARRPKNSAEPPVQRVEGSLGEDTTLRAGLSDQPAGVAGDSADAPGRIATTDGIPENELDRLARRCTTRLQQSSGSRHGARRAAPKSRAVRPLRQRQKP